jgi:cytochrome c oxidase subunit III
MPTIRERVDRERKPKLGGGGPGKIPRQWNYGGGDDGDHDHQRHSPSYEQRLRRLRVAMVLGIVSVTMLFVFLIVAYLFSLHMGHYDQLRRQTVSDWHPLALPYALLLINSAVLVCSSLTLELARRQSERQAEFRNLGIVPIHSTYDPPWLGLTVLLGFAFLVGQILAWKFLKSAGVFHLSDPGRAFFYILTGTHAAHLSGGLIALVWALGRRFFRQQFESRQLTIEVTSWYWHFMAGLWFVIFGLMHFWPG